MKNQVILIFTLCVLFTACAPKNYPAGTDGQNNTSGTNRANEETIDVSAPATSAEELPGEGGVRVKQNNAEAQKIQLSEVKSIK